MARVLAFGLLAAVSRAELVPMADFYRLTAQDIDGKSFSFSELQGKEEIVITSVATHCPMAGRHFEDFQKLQDRNEVAVVAFPTNSFGTEPSRPADIKWFAQFKNMRVNEAGSSFKLMSMVEVNGGNEHDVFTFLKRHTDDDRDILWTFRTSFFVKCDEPNQSCNIRRVDSTDLPSTLLTV